MQNLRYRESERKSQNGASTISSALFTIIRNARGPLSKAFALHAGQLQKTAAADLTDGTATRVAVTDLREFAKILEGLGSHEALDVRRHRSGAGEAVHPGRARLGTRASRRNLPGPSEFRMAERPRHPHAGHRQAERWKAAASLAVSSIGCCLRCFRGGAQARGCIALRPPPSFTTYDGNELSGAGSLRCYPIVDNGENISFVGVAIADALWKAGHGRIEFGAAGQALVRCPVDTAVWQPRDWISPGRLSRSRAGQAQFPPNLHGADIDTEAAISAGPGKVTVAAWASNSIEVRRARCSSSRGADPAPGVHQAAR